MTTCFLLAVMMGQAQVADPPYPWCPDSFVIQSRPATSSTATNIWTSGDREFTWDGKRLGYSYRTVGAKAEEGFAKFVEGWMIDNRKSIVLSMEGGTYAVQLEWNRFWESLSFYKKVAPEGPRNYQRCVDYVIKMRKDWKRGRPIELPDLTLASGQKLTAASLKGQTVVLALFGTAQSDPFWVNTAVGLQRVHDEWAGKGVKVVGVFMAYDAGERTQDNKPLAVAAQARAFEAGVARYARGTKISIPVGMGYMMREGAQLMMFEQPGTWVIDPQGRVQFYQRGWPNEVEPNTPQFIPNLVRPVLKQISG
jgi:hypothetical protein